MHVLILAHDRHPLREPFAGGLEAMTWHLARHLVERGERVSVVATAGSEVAGELIDLDATLRLSSAARNDVSMPSAEWMLSHHRYLRAMLELTRRDDIDIIHNNSLHYLPLSMADVLPAPMLTTLHTPPTPWLESAIQLMPTDRSSFVAVSRATRRAWSHLLSATVVPNGVDTRTWRPGPGGDALVWSGRMVPEKGPHLALDIAEQTGLPLRLAGPIADPGYFADAIRPRLRGGLEYAGHLRRHELCELVGSSAAQLVTPRWDEPYGLVAAEALACATPVLSFDRGGLGDIVSPAVGRLVPADDVEAAVGALPEVLTLSREACRDHAVAHLGLDRMGEKYLRAYRSMAALRGVA